MLTCRSLHQIVLRHSRYERGAKTVTVQPPHGGRDSLKAPRRMLVADRPRELNEIRAILFSLAQPVDRVDPKQTHWPHVIRRCQCSRTWPEPPELSRCFAVVRLPSHPPLKLK